MTRFEKGFNIVVIFTTLLVLYLLALDIFFDTTDIDDTLFVLDIIITFVFLIDLVMIYRVSKGFKDFVRSNWLDIISVIPFSMAFRLTKIFRAVRLVRLVKGTTKVTKAAKAMKVSKTTTIIKVSKGMRIKSQVPRTGKLMSKISGSKKKKRKGKKKKPVHKKKKTLLKKKKTVLRKKGGKA